MYLIPPSLQQKYTAKFDVWSIGITFFELLAFTIPFKTKNDINKKDLIIPATISASTKALLTKML